MDRMLTARQRQTVVDLLQVERTPEKALEVAVSAFVWVEHSIRLFESVNALPTPLACSPGCDYCCHNQVEVTPPEALLIGNYLEKQFSPRELGRLLEKLEYNLSVRSGKSKIEVARIRQELPCPFLRQGNCSIYAVRPLVCRAMHALDASQCKQALHTQDRQPVAYYAHRHDITMAVIQGLLEGCRAFDCQAQAVDLIQALYDYFQHDKPVQQWLQGKKVFRRVRQTPRQVW